MPKKENVISVQIIKLIEPVAVERDPSMLYGILYAY
jgi:hypothetical protein